MIDEKTLRKLKLIGFDDWYINQDSVKHIEDLQIARIIEVHKDRFIISDGESQIPAELVGKFLFRMDSSLAFPTVGDWVLIQLFDDSSAAVIHDLLPRRSVLRRKTAGKKVDFQLIAANIDYSMIMQSLDADFNLNRLERYLSIVLDGGITPMVLLSKSDLLPAAEVEDKKRLIQQTMPDLHVITFSNRNHSEVNRIVQQLIPAKTYCLLGSSGVGKTTLLNNLIGDDQFTTGEVRQKDKRGRHITTRRHLIRLEGGALLIDNPGMRELGMLASQHGIDETFSDISDLAAQCQFNDCSHDHEDGCAVIQALKTGTLTQQRYQNYLKVINEARRHEMSYYEKRKKDKQLGKLYREILRHKKSNKGL